MGVFLRYKANYVEITHNFALIKLTPPFAWKTKYEKRALVAATITAVLPADQNVKKQFQNYGKENLK